MNSYPPELLAQLAPVMFVAGLDVPQQVPATPAIPATPQSPSTKFVDPFHALIARLREALSTQRKVAIWQPEKSKTFHVILTDKDVRFPPRKLVPPDDPQYASAHSPLSPLTPSSPLHPDGIVAPIWIRKHTTLVPSVFVTFMRLYEHPPTNIKSPLEGPEVDREREREAEERRRDSELSAEIALRKKSTNERNIKLTVVLLASRRMLDDPALDARLTFIRRNSGLDSRAALFVLSPVSQAELGEFVKSLTQALYEPALEYYTAHSKRVRRKRNRHSTSVASYPGPPLGNIARPLRPEGWTVRYEYKMACFAEFRGEDEVALKHYQDSYDMLVIMFGSPAILPPRTKRWAEAKVLADTINTKITKLYLYNNEHSLALSHHMTHVRKFSDFSRGWGIGEETFEYWSWVARQNRLFSELLEQGMRSTLVIPVHKPQMSALSLAASLSQTLNPNLQRSGGVDVDPRTFGLNPSHSLQHPGFYYYAAARCTELRRVKFHAALRAEQNGQPISLSPGFTNEKKVDHNTIILELYTKAYELFKKYNPGDPSSNGQGRLTLWIAYRIAQTYCDSGQFEMAIRFFERIARTYRREHWGEMLRPLLTTWYACAKRLGDLELSIRLLLEIMGYDADTPDEDPTTLEEDLVAVLKSSVPKSSDAFVIELTEAKPLFNTNTVFWSSSVKVGDVAAFQISLTAPTSISISSLPFSSLGAYLEEGNEPSILVRHSSEKGTSAVQWINIGNVSSQEPVEVEANLRWDAGNVLVISGTMTSNVPTVLQISKLVLTLELGAWKIELPLRPCAGRQRPSTVGKWLSYLNPPRFVAVKREQYSSTTVKHRPHQVVVYIQHEAPAYLDENYPLTIEVTNLDDKDLDVTLDALLQPTDVDGAFNKIILDNEQSPSLIKGVNCGTVKPSASVVKTIHLLSGGAAGDRMLDISVQTKISEGSPLVGEEDRRANDVTEKLQTIVVPTLEAFHVTQEATYQHNLREWHGPTHLGGFDEDYVDEERSMEVTVVTDVSIAEPWSVYVEHIALAEGGAEVKLLDTSLESEDEELFPRDFLPGDEFNISSRFTLLFGDDGGIKAPQTLGHYMVQWRRVFDNGEHSKTSITRIQISTPKLPQENVVALLDVPPIAKLHVPLDFNISIRNYNPTTSANILCQLDIDNADDFVVSGLRSGRIPILLPGAEEKISWRLIPMECGYLQLPKIKVHNRRKAVAQAQSNTDGPAGIDEGEIVEIIDVGRDRKLSTNTEANQHAKFERGEGSGQMSILVLP